jgi:hypothetical protein
MKIQTRKPKVIESPGDLVCTVSGSLVEFGLAGGAVIHMTKDVARWAAQELLMQAAELDRLMAVKFRENLRSVGR